MSLLGNYISSFFWFCYRWLESLVKKRISAPAVVLVEENKENILEEPGSCERVEEMAPALSTPAGAVKKASGNEKAKIAEKKQVKEKETGKGKGKGKDSQTSRTYLKVSAKFKCTKEECGKVWNSVHVWDDEVRCEFCKKLAKLADAADEYLEIDTYRCSKEGCDNTWQTIHYDDEEEQECDVCQSMVKPDGKPQKRFGRHYWFECRNKKCQEEDQRLCWEDFSIDAPKAQRCSACFSQGTIIKVTKGRPFFRRRSNGNASTGGENGSSNKENEGGNGERNESPKQENGRGRRRNGSPKQENGGGDAGGPADKRDRSAAGTTHNPELCDMCQDIIRQKKGTSCHRLRKIICRVEKNADGIIEEKIVDAL